MSSEIPLLQSCRHLLRTGLHCSAEFTVLPPNTVAAMMISALDNELITSILQLLTVPMGLCFFIDPYAPPSAGGSRARMSRSTWYGFNDQAECNTNKAFMYFGPLHLATNPRPAKSTIRFATQTLGNLKPLKPPS